MTSCNLNAYRYHYKGNKEDAENEAKDILIP